MSLISGYASKIRWLGCRDEDASLNSNNGYRDYVVNYHCQQNRVVDDPDHSRHARRGREAMSVAVWQGSSPKLGGGCRVVWCNIPGEQTTKNKIQISFNQIKTSANKVTKKKEWTVKTSG